MKLLPALARLDYGARRFWLPVFLLWPLMLLLFALTFFAGVICASRGTQIDVDASDCRISLTLR